MVNAVKRLKRPKQITIEEWERILGCSSGLPMMDFCLIFARREKMIKSVCGRKGAVKTSEWSWRMNSAAAHLVSWQIVDCHLVFKLVPLYLFSHSLIFSLPLSLSLSLSLSMFNLYPSPAHQLFDRIPLVKSSLLIHCQIPPSSFLSLSFFIHCAKGREREKGLSSARESERKLIGETRRRRISFMPYLYWPSHPFLSIQCSRDCIRDASSTNYTRTWRAFASWSFSFLVPVRRSSPITSRSEQRGAQF